MPLPTSAFDYTLPPELIAQEPVAERGTSRLLIVRRLDDASPRRLVREPGQVPEPRHLAEAPRRPGDEPPATDASFPDLLNLVAAGDLLVLNTTRVRHARFLGSRESGRPAEVLLIHPATNGEWVAIGKPGSALRPGKRVAIGDGAFIETLEVLEEGFRRVRFVGIRAEEALDRIGKLPLPPYIEREPTDADEARYQTVYAEREGSVAAPTAGLHFTPALLEALERKGVEIARIDLEVGTGTFKPVEVEDPSLHPMHPEWYEIPEAAAQAVDRLRERGGKIWAVGTTVVRALESSATDAGRIEAGRRETRLLITPGYQFKVVDHLITNFHLPRSTLLMLVSAFGGYERIMAAYRHAVEQRYRFYSYGDAMVVI